MWAASIQPKILEISVGTSNGTDHFDLVRPEYLGPSCGPLLAVWLVRPQCPFPLTKVLSPVPLFCILLARTITKHTVAWVRSVQPKCTISLGTWNFRNFKILLNGKRPLPLLINPSNLRILLLSQIT